MSTIERMERYIQLTKTGNIRYDLKLSETYALVSHINNENPDTAIDAIWIAFQYGRAKGYREATKEVRGK